MEPLTIIEVQFSVLDPDKKWRANRTAFVVTVDIGRAIGLIQERYPDCRIAQAIRRCRGDEYSQVIIDV